MYCYSLFGHRLQSEFEIPEAGPPAAFGVETEQEILIGLGSVPRELSGMTRMAGEYEVSGPSILFRAWGIAHFLIEDGKMITIDLEPGASMASMRIFLLGSAMAALLHQRRDFPLHASAVASSGKCFAFLGDSGAGKSTTATLLSRLGMPLLSDDVLAISEHPDGIAVARSGIPTLKLWQDSAQFFGQAAAADFDAPDHRKHKRTDPGLFTTEQQTPLGGLIFLEWLMPPDAPPEFLPVAAFEALTLLRSNVYRQELVRGLGHENDFMQMAARIVSRVPALRLRRSMSFAAVRPLSQGIADCLTALAQR